MNIMERKKLIASSSDIETLKILIEENDLIYKLLKHNLNNVKYRLLNMFQITDMRCHIACEPGRMLCHLCPLSSHNNGGQSLCDRMQDIATNNAFDQPKSYITFLTIIKILYDSVNLSQKSYRIDI